MPKQDCQLNHSRNLSTSYKSANYYYDRERSRATAKQVKFFRRLWYMFKDNGLDIKEECEKRDISYVLIQDPSGRCGFSTAINYMIDILTDVGIYQSKSDKKKDFVCTYTKVIDNGGAVERSWQKIEYHGEGETNEDVE